MEVILREDVPSLGKAGQIVNADLPSSGAENRSVYEDNAERLAIVDTAKFVVAGAAK